MHFDLPVGPRCQRSNAEWTYHIIYIYTLGLKSRFLEMPNVHMINNSGGSLCGQDETELVKGVGRGVRRGTGGVS